MYEVTKKSRSANFSPGEEWLLLEEVVKEKDIIECKSTNKISISQKEEAWERIKKNFNAGNSICRNTNQLKSKYDNLKTKARRAAANHRVQVAGRTGSARFPDNLDPILEVVLNIINSKTMVGLESASDSSDKSYDNFVTYEFSTSNVKMESGLEPELVTGINNSSDIENDESSAGTSYGLTALNIKIENDSQPELVSSIDSLSDIENDESSPITSNGLTQIIDEDTPHRMFEAVQDDQTKSLEDKTEIPLKGKSLKRCLDNNCNQYVPEKLKEPVDKQIRPAVSNCIESKAEYYKNKTIYVKLEIEASKARELRAKREEERKEDEHKIKMEMLAIELQLKKKALNS